MEEIQIKGSNDYEVSAMALQIIKQNPILSPAWDKSIVGDKHVATIRAKSKLEGGK